MVLISALVLTNHVQKNILITVKVFALNHVLPISQTMVLMFVLTNLVHRLVRMDLLFSTENALYQLKMFYCKLFQQLNAIHFV